MTELGKRNRKSSRRSLLLRAVVAAGVGSASLLLFVNNQASATTTSLGGWNVTADGNAVDIVYDNTTGLAGIHPFTEADLPEASSQFESGPFGSSLASILWPGSAGGNFGSLSGELGLPSQLQPVVSQLNDPVKASAQYPAGPAAATYPAGSNYSAAEMKATASATGTTATSALVDQDSQGVLSFTSAKGSSSSTATSTAVATATSDVGDISILGGLIDIGGVKSSATATSDGNTSSGTASTDVGDVTVMGQKASLGSDGLVLPNLTSALPPLVSSVVGPAVQSALSQEIQALGITIKQFPSTQTQNGPIDTITSGGLQIAIDPPSAVATSLEQVMQVLAPYFPAQAAIIPTLPGILQGGSLTITLGRATASSAASPSFNLNFTPAPNPTGSGTTGTSTGSTPVPTGSSAAAVPASSGTGTSTGTGTGSMAGTGGATLAPTPSSPSASTGASASPTSGVATAAPPSTLIGLSKPLGAGAIALGVLGSLVLAYSLWCLARMLLPKDVGPVCPLGADN